MAKNSKAYKKCGGGQFAALEAMLGPLGIKGLETTGAIDCRGYGVMLTPWWCIENQLSPFCLPGFPCENCEAGVTIIAKVGCDASRSSRAGARISLQSGTPSLKRAKIKGYDPKIMSRAVARDLELI